MSAGVYLRMDDVGASTKQYEQYAAIRWQIAGRRLPTPSFLQWGPLKRVPYWQGWGPYPELSEGEWSAIGKILRERGAKLTVGVTATWAESATELIPFNQKFPRQTSIIRELVQENVLEIANHGLTHCVLSQNRFRPQRWQGNRRWHREFWGWVPLTTQREHVLRSQELLQKIFAIPVVTFIPSGHVWTTELIPFLVEAGIRYLSTSSASLIDRDPAPLRVIDPHDVIAFHDREIVLQGTSWLAALLARQARPYALMRQYDNGND